MSAPQLILELLPYELSIARTERGAVPSWALQSRWFSISLTDDELSLVCESSHIPAGTTVEAGWRGLKVRGPLGFSLTGILASLASPLALAQISIFAVSTFETDYILVKEGSLEATVQVLRAHEMKVVGM